MVRLARQIFLLLIMGILVTGASASPPLYHQVAGGEEDYPVGPKTTLNRVALEKGVQWQVMARQNGLKKPFKVKEGMVLKINNTHIVPAELTDGLIINLPELKLYHFIGGVYQRRYSLAVGKPSWPTPTGNYKIIEKRKNPTWNVPPSIQDEMEAMGLEVVEKVPPGPKNPLGKYFMATSASGVGIHSTNRPWSVGHFVSHGCIRMLPDEVEQLFSQVAVGTPLKIIYRCIKMAVTPEGRVFLEANPNIYDKELDALAYVHELAHEYQLREHIDWGKVPAILKAHDGIAQDITKGGPLAPSVIPPVPTPTPQEVRLSPLQRPEAKLE